MAIAKPQHYEKTRLEAFSDGVFAIVITLLILDIRLPVLHHPNNVTVLHALIAIMPKIFVYCISFLNIAVYWINHHQLFSVLKKTDRGFLWLNCLLLLVLAFIPFPTSVIGEYPKTQTAIIFFGSVMILAAIIFGTMRLYSWSFGCLIDCELTNNACAKADMIKSYLGGVLYLIAILIGFLSTTVAIILFFLIPLFYAFPSRLTTACN